MPTALPRQPTLDALPPEWLHDLLPAIQAQVAAQRRTLVVLDDDPTGTQTVYDLPVLTGWSVEQLRAEFARGQAVFYVLTNSRSMPAAAANALHEEIGRNLVHAAKRANREFVVVSRSDSTLRGHFPGEVAALVDGLGQPFDGWLLIPFFAEGGRYTIDNVQYVGDGEQLIPVGETEFARDHMFGFASSDVRAWVAEKTGGRVAASDVATISLHDIRVGGPEQVATQLMALTGQVCVVNAASMRDLHVVALAVLETEAHNKRWMYRTAASFVQARAGLAPAVLLEPDQLGLPTHGGGLIVVGSYVPTTTRQLHALLAQTTVAPIELAVPALLDQARAADEIMRVAAAANEQLQRGADVVVFTSRDLVAADETTDSLDLGQRVSAGLVAVVRAIATRPRYVVAKGGITSSDLATRGLGVTRAMVRGQILPGVPVWQLDASSRYVGLTYIVFPGNIGGPTALADLVALLAPKANR